MTNFWSCTVAQTASDFSIQFLSTPSPRKSGLWWQASLSTAKAHASSKTVEFQPQAYCVYLIFWFFSVAAQSTRNATIGWFFPSLISEKTVTFQRSMKSCEKNTIIHLKNNVPFYKSLRYQSILKNPAFSKIKVKTILVSYEVNEISIPVSFVEPNRQWTEHKLFSQHPVCA